MILLSIVTVAQIGFIAGAIYGIKNNRKKVRRIKREIDRNRTGNRAKEERTW